MAARLAADGRLRADFFRAVRAHRMVMTAGKRRTYRSWIAGIAVLLSAVTVCWRIARAPENGFGPGASPTPPVAPMRAAAATRARAPKPGQQASPVAAAAVRAMTASRSLPPSGAPLAQTYAELEARANAGDAAAASRLYRDVQRCRAARDYQRTIAQMQSPQGEAAVFTFTSALETREHMLSEMREFVDRSAQRCAGATRAQLDALVPAMFRAAQLGDTRATNCYAGGGLEMMPGLLDHPEWVADMRAVPQLLDHAVRQGDWVAVELLHHAYAGVFGGTPAAQAIRPEPAMDYRYLRLERLGATGAFVQKVDRMLADAAGALTAQQIADGDAWANDTYAHYFSGSSSNEVSNGANICGAED